MDTARNGQTILLGEDESEVRNYIELALRCRGYDVESAEDGDQVLKYLESGNPVSAVLLDIMMPRRDGFDTLRGIRRMSRDLPVIMLSGASATFNVVEAMKSGATDFLGKPVDHQTLERTLRKAIAERAESHPGADGPRLSFFGSTPAMAGIQALAGRVGPSDVPVLIQGETGTGKEVLARELHALSARSTKPFLKLNCAALPSELVESELFGYERGAFTGAMQRKPGMFEMAEGGTLLLDEIGDMELKLQAKLLQVLQDHEFRRLGGKEAIQVDVRVLAASHRNLETAIHTGAFREDLYYRLNVITFHLPALRQRTDDIQGLAEFLLARHSKTQPAPALTPGLLDAFRRYDWPGNIRELENAIRQYVVLRDPDLIAQELETKILRSATQAESRSTGPSSVLVQASQAKEKAETAAILAALHATRWNRKQAAAKLNIDYKALLYKMKKLAIEDKPPAEA